MENGIYLNYYVMFSAENPSTPYSPIVGKSFKKSLGTGNRLHGFDSEIECILPALWYCLQLPRIGLDTLDISPKTIASGYSVPHDIQLIPSYINFESVGTGIIKMKPPTLLIYDDSCEEVALKFASYCAAPLGSVPISALSSELLKKHWIAITQLIQKRLNKKNSPLYVKPEFLLDYDRSALPTSFLTNQLNIPHEKLGNKKKSDFSFAKRLSKAVYMRSVLNTLVELEEKGVFNPSKDDWSKIFDLQLESTKVPIVITMPGTAARIRPRSSKVEKQTLDSTEKTVFSILGLHRAAARGGVWLDGNTLPAELFVELHHLEKHCREAQQSNRFVWESMKRIGKSLADLLGSDGPAALHRASHITAFSDFPIGLAILPGVDDPLCCIKPISYRPLTPLTRTLQYELPRIGEHYIGRGFKVVIAECLPHDDKNKKIRSLSDGAWRLIIDNLKSDSRVNVIYSDVQSIEALKKLLLEHKDADILVISAHGSYDDKRNLAGLSIGEEVWLAHEDDIRVPPVVILSACHVAPRGLGAITVNDLLLRAGAITVIGTLIPVNVNRNALLTGRLFTYISEALSGRGQFRSLDEAWEFVVKSNAVNEILVSSERLMMWAHHRPEGKQSPIEEFMLTRSIGRLRVGSIYSDTIEVLRELANEDGLREYFDAVLSSQGFFPESCFYVLTGSPENVILTEPILEKFIDKGFK